MSCRVEGHLTTDASPAVPFQNVHSFMEIYLDQIRDLGAAAQAHLKATAARLPPPISGDAAGSAGLSLSAYAADGGGAPGRSSATSLSSAADYIRTSLDVMEDSSGMTFVKDLTFMEVRREAFLSNMWPPPSEASWEGGL